MAYTLYPNERRGTAFHGWLRARHSFSFAGWQDQTRMGVSALRVINEDQIAAHNGFGMHSHDNMEILTCVLSGHLTHKDSMGNVGHLSRGQWQLMSAGTGVTHSEMNDGDVPVHLLQIWLYPNVRNPAPNYQELTLDVQTQANQWHLIAAPETDGDHASAMTIRQDARILSTYLNQGQSLPLEGLKTTNYVHVVTGQIHIQDTTTKETRVLSAGDAINFDRATKSLITADQDSQLIWFDLP